MNTLWYDVFEIVSEVFGVAFFLSKLINKGPHLLGRAELYQSVLVCQLGVF